ncbi:uncharacterized protein LOC110446593 [Mizuhopecten yessoensis]|uniref:uncharacterized protein LOC110446593 n=1 Tax=Mizuhopecten yessoensis TaxID=6573 RepID=UPI000B45A2DD|nr:uncharacterized protein LOC110446593 [Mizuhopecten yessoensis]XP_021347479.1 uncharacterized protein LOC110446593 [Mizuhopecten yessoensis]XP_021347480.1 uncharacterized protein LOC110446593 [Mizuhopecten yessoensis]XP_021347481.1 uncharacterized protein LOC110446593 [Mizuhopecten yessoensis]XP_021347482.1 uncharacterized protein LOC110446593 [Mizuhopecten yessoensis]XP_021347483.1 uncharacterized protein LOC110446593 [Mizuhopecten yessoensis]XP_021347484.1 uncharacterized protein LOC11044
MIALAVFVLVLLFPCVEGNCKVDEILLKEDFDPYQFEGKWYLVSMTRLWGMDFSPRNFSESTGRTSWGDNANKFFGRWSRGKNGSNWGDWRRRGGNGTSLSDATRRPGSTGGRNTRGPWGTEGAQGGRWSGMRQGESSTGTTSGYPQRSSNGEEWLRNANGTDTPTDIPMRPPGGRGNPPPRDGVKQGGWPDRSGGPPRRNTTPPDRRHRDWSNPRSAMSRRFKKVFRPKNFQLQTAVREDSNIDMFIVGEFFGRCIFTKGQGSITNPRNTAKLEVNFPVQWFLPCQPFWIVDTDYVGYSVVYFCLEVLDDGTCDPDSATVWTFNRKLTGHGEKEMDKVRKAMERLCIDEADLTAMNQTEYCPIEDENVQDQRNSKPTIHCNNADQQMLRIALDSPYDFLSSGNTAASMRSFAPKRFPSLGLMFLTLLTCFLLLWKPKSIMLQKRNQ